MFFPGTILCSSDVQKAISNTIDDQSKDSFCKTSENYIVLTLFDISFFSVHLTWGGGARGAPL